MKQTLQFLKLEANPSLFLNTSLYFEYLLLLINKENLNNSLKQSIAAALLSIIQKLSLTVWGEHSRLQWTYWVNTDY